MPTTTVATSPSDVRLVDMPSLRVAAVAGPMACAEDIHPIHKKFVELLISDVPRAMSFEGVRAPSGGQVRTGALVYGDYSKPDPVMSAFKQCLFIGNGDVPAGNISAVTDLEALKAADPAVSMEATPPGLYAVVTHSGEYAELASLAHAMMYQVLPQMGLVHSGGPLVEFYNGPGPDGLPLTDVAIPVSRLP